jgi:hypothetical protein
MRRESMPTDETKNPPVGLNERMGTDAHFS